MGQSKMKACKKMICEEESRAHTGVQALNLRMIKAGNGIPLAKVAEGVLKGNEEDGEVGAKDMLGECLRQCASREK